MEDKNPTPTADISRNNEVEDANESDDEIFSKLEKEIEDDFDMAAFREQRLEGLKRE